MKEVREEWELKKEVGYILLLFLVYHTLISTTIQESLIEYLKYFKSQWGQISWL